MQTTTTSARRRRNAAGQDDTCWRCGVAWATEGEPRTILRLVPAGAPSEAEPDTERWTNEGGGLASAATR